MIINSTLLLIIKITTFVGKLYLLLHTRVFRKQATPSTKPLWILLTIVLMCTAFGDFTWIIKLLNKLSKSSLGGPLDTTVLFLLRIAWISSGLEYLAMGIFIEKLTSKDFKLSTMHKLLIGMCAIPLIVISYIALFNFHIISPSQRTFEYMIYGILTCYTPLSIVPSLYIAFRRSASTALPRILRHQARILIKYFLAPHVILIAAIANPFTTASLQAISVDRYIFIAISDLLYLIALFFSARKMLGLRFLNVNSHVQSHGHYDFIYDFKAILTKLGDAVTFTQLEHITVSFFERAFQVNPEHVRLSIRATKTASPEHAQGTTSVLPAVEKFLLDDAQSRLIKHIASVGILIRDELEFDHFYEGSPHQQELIALLTTLDADIFLPIYERQTMVAYVIVRHRTRPQQLFSNIERDEMCVFANYLGNIIYLFQHRNLTEVIRQEKEWKDNLYNKQQEINHYKESIRTLLKSNVHDQIGLILCQQRTLLWANGTIRDMLQIRSPHEDHPLYTPALKQLSRDAVTYRSDRQISLNDPEGRQITFRAPYITSERTSVVILAYYADLFESFSIPFETLKDVAAWEYALYLETTKSGQIINQMIPGSTDAIFNFKIDLLKAALSKKATLLELPEDDISSIVNILHCISLRSTLHTMMLRKAERNNEIGIQLFGLEPVLSTDLKDGLLTTLNETGTLFIQNIELLSLETQQRLALFLGTGLFNPFKSERSLRSNVRLICSTSTNLDLLVEQRKFSRELLTELRNAPTISFPSLLTMPQHELNQLARRVTEQALQSRELRNLVSLSDEETNSIVQRGPSSLHELKQQIQVALNSKTSKKKLSHIVKLEPGHHVDLVPEVAHAVRLGKRALRDKHMLTLLCNTFQSQTKIATLLNVNRSSVNRRCKEFNITID